MVKDLNINNIVHAKYIIDKGILYLNCTQKFFKKDLTESEQICIWLIKLIDEEKFNTVAYMNEKNLKQA